LTITTTQADNKDVNMRVVEVLRSVLATREMPPGELADMIGMDAAAFDRRMSGETSFYVCEVAAICGCLRVPLSTVL
jgi:hypothetical protein